MSQVKCILKNNSGYDLTIAIADNFAAIKDTRSVNSCSNNIVT